VDEWYEPFICHAGFLSLARLFTYDLPLMDSTVLTALVDQWCLETHMFHLPCGKATVTLQDVATILGLPIDDTPVCGLVSSAGWRDSIGEAIDLQPPTSPSIRRARRQRACTPSGSELTSTSARRVLRTQSFRGMFGVVFGIWMTNDSLVT
jgi:hypothetical protein